MINGFSGNVNLNTGSKPPTSILPPKTSAGAIRPAFGMDEVGTEILSGALTANVYKEIVSLSTSGVLRMCGVMGNNTTSRTLGLKVVIDGVTVFDEVTAAFTTADAGFFAVGFATLTGSGVSNVFESFNFNKTLSLQIKSSLSETDNLSLVYLTAVT